MRRAVLACCLVATVLPLPGHTAGLDRALSHTVRANMDGALSVLGLAAVPSETASTLFLKTGKGSGSGYDFQAGQLGGGFTLSESLPIWLEGYLGWNRYDPLLVFSDGDRDARLPLKWTSIAATGGIGYDIALSPDWVLRPELNLSLGRVQTDLSVGAQVAANRLGVDADYLRNGGIWAGGLGGSLGLAYNHRWADDREADLSLRQTWIHLEPIAGDSDLAGAADAITTTLWTRYRVPTGYHAFDRPVRIVFEGSASALSGDQGKALDTDWLAQLGIGGEIDLAETWVPWVTTTRAVMRYTRGEHLEGFSIGLACSF